MSISAALLHFLLLSYLTLLPLSSPLAFPFCPAEACGPALPLLYTKHCTLRGPWLVVHPRCGNKPLCSGNVMCALRALDGQTFLFSKLSTIISSTCFLLCYIIICRFWHLCATGIKQHISVLYKRGRKMTRAFVEQDEVFACYVKPLTRYLCTSLPLSSGPHIPTPNCRPKKHNHTLPEKPCGQ